MKNLLILLIILLISSCGPVELPIEEGQGLNRIEQINIENRLDNFELTSLREVCDNLKTKDTYFKSSIINFNKTFDYNITKKKCNSSEDSIYDVSLKAKSSGTNIFFDLSEGSGEYISEYESHNNGIIAPFCNKLYSTIGSFERFVEIGNQVSWIYVLGLNQTYCPESTSSTCVVIENGEIIGDSRAQVYERHSMAISKFNSNLKGMIIGRKFETTTGCEQGFRSLHSKLSF